MYIETPMHTGWLGLCGDRGEGLQPLYPFFPLARGQEWFELCP